MSDSDKDSESGSGSGSGSDRDESGSEENERGSGSGSDSGSGSGSGSGSDSNSDSSSSGSDSDSGKKKKKKKGKENAIDDLEDSKPKIPIYYELQNIMRSILMDLSGVERKVDELEMRFNPKPKPAPQQRAPARPSPTRNYFPPGYQGNQVHFDEPMDLKGVLKQTPPQAAYHHQDATSEHGGTASYASHGRTSSLGRRQPSYDNLSSQQYPMQTPVLYPGSGRNASMPQQQQPYYNVQQALPANFGATGPYTKYLRTQINPEPTYTNRFFKHEPMQMRPMTSRFVNTARNPSPRQTQQTAIGTARNYSEVHNQQQMMVQSARPPLPTQMQAATGFQPATTLQDYDQAPQVAAMDAQEGDLTQRQQYTHGFAVDMREQPKLQAGPPPGVGSTSERLNLARIEDAIDCLLAQ